MPGVPREKAEHSLHLKLRRFAQDRKEAIRVELNKLLAAGFIRECMHPEWLANPVVDSTAGCLLLSFLDCYSGYHQIALNPDDQDKTAFITPHGIYCYKTMTFGLKNAGATYQKAIQGCLDTQIGRNAEAYVDDVVVKTYDPDALIADLQETFNNLRRYRWKLNPTKCVFGVPSGKLLGFLVSQRGIEANPTKIKAIQDLPPPKNKKEVMKLTGMMAALSRFISKLGERGAPFFKILRKADKFEWTPEANQALADLKAAGRRAPRRRTLLSSAEASILRQRSTRRIKTPVSAPTKITLRALNLLQKTAPLLSGSSYHVVSNFPLGEILHNRDINGRVVKWAIKTVHKIPSIGRLLAEWTELQAPTPAEPPEHWTLYFDGALNLEGAGAGVLLISPEGKHLKYVLQIHYQATNNGAEYEALIHGLRIAITLGIKRLLCYGDSKVVVEQVNKNWECSKETMDAYCAESAAMSREENVAADVLSKLGSKRSQVPAGIFVQDLRKPSIKLTNESHPTTPADQVVSAVSTTPEVNNEEDWREPFIAFIKNDRMTSENKLEEDKVALEQLSRRSANYVVIGAELYRKSASSGVLMKCILRSEGLALLHEVHSGTCSNHAAAKTLVGKVYRSGSFSVVPGASSSKSKSTCRLRHYAPSHLLGPSQYGGSITWDHSSLLRGELSTYSSRWTSSPNGSSTRLSPTPSRPQQRLYRRDNSPLRCPESHITDLGSQFTGHEFWDLCQDRQIDVYYSSSAHPRCNGQVERANGMVLDALKKEIYDALNPRAGRWAKEVPHVVWGLRTQRSRATGYSPFFMVYGSEAVLPADLAFAAPRIKNYEEGEAESSRQVDVDALEEHRLCALTRHARHEQQIRRYHDRNVKERSLNVGDLALRRVMSSAGQHKLSAPWEGPFIVKEVVSPGTYRLEWADGNPVPNVWNIQHLTKFYP
ncbi:GAG-POL precursor [Gossypium australe]|uniref:GAG-POL n=1 Tax=Gossypium australe TaxID=47621 RepID=A0A5B6TSA0_9ROSI|nr:GAG-POL precursor [Gossypium australe]